MKRPGCYELFDSLANPDRLSELGLKGKCFFNQTILQPAESVNCGWYVLYFLVCRYHNPELSFKRVLKTYFYSDPAQNELVVKQFALDHCVSSVLDRQHDNGSGSR